MMTDSKGDGGRPRPAVVIGHPSISSEQVERILIDYAGAAVGVDLAGRETALTRGA
jgi:hypothetical protein